MNRSQELAGLIQINIYDGIDKKIIVDHTDLFYPTIEKGIKTQIEKKKVPKNIIDFYSTTSNGIKLSWFSNPTEGIGGRIHFLKIDKVLKNQKGILYFEEDLNTFSTF